MKNNTQLTNELNDLLARSYDAIEGYQLAANNIDEPALQSFFERQAQMRIRFTEELTIEVERLKGTAIDGGSWTGVLHRAWMNLRDLIASRDINEMVEEAVRGEEKALNDYNDFLKDDNENPTYLNNVIRSQRDEIRSALNTLRGFLAAVDA